MMLFLICCVVCLRLSKLDTQISQNYVDSRFCFKVIDILEQIGTFSMVLYNKWTHRAILYIIVSILYQSISIIVIAILYIYMYDKSLT